MTNPPRVHYAKSGAVNIAYRVCGEGPLGQAIVEAVGAIGLDVRARLHTGECEVRGQDLAGVAVHIAARVAAHAASGEVVVSGSVPPLVAGSGIAFADRGEHELKGVPGPWRICAAES